MKYTLILILFFVITPISSYAMDDEPGSKERTSTRYASIQQHLLDDDDYDSSSSDSEEEATINNMYCVKRKLPWIIYGLCTTLAYGSGAAYWLYSTWQDKECLDEANAVINVTDQQACEDAQGEWTNAKRFNAAILFSVFGWLIPGISWTLAYIKNR